MPSNDEVMAWTLQSDDEVRAMAWTVLYSKQHVGLNAWPWYRAALPRMLAEMGIEEMMHDATQEMSRLLDCGYPPRQAMQLTEAYLRGLWRPRYDAKASTYVPPTTAIDERVHAVPVPSSKREDGEAVEVLLAVRSATTDEQWQMLEAYADSDSLRTAAERCGVSHETVRRALARARAAVGM